VHFIPYISIGKDEYENLFELADKLKVSLLAKLIKRQVGDSMWPKYTKKHHASIHKNINEIF